MLQGNGLLLGRGESHGRFLRKLHESRKRRRRIATAMGFMFFKLPLIDPDRMLDAIYSYVRPVMNRAGFWLAMVFMLVSAIAVGLHIQRISDLAMPVLGWQNLLILSAVFFVVKVIHEFGHGLAAKHRGLEVHEMGVLFMVFLPLYYVDTTDAWMVPRRRDRLWINAGGVFIEFIVSSIAAWVWVGTDPGLVNQIAFNVMLATSVTTLLFNANPLLRYDGYYFLMDWLEIPNLRAKAMQYVGYLVKRYLLAMNDVYPPPEAARKPIFMPLYAASSGIYRVMVTLGIIALVWHILDPYGLSVIGTLLGLFAILTMVVLPALKWVRFVITQQARTWRRIGTSLAGLAVLGLIAWGILSIPMEHTVEHPAVALAEQRQPLYVPVTGLVEEVFVRDGAVLRMGDPILRLREDTLTDRYERLLVQRRMSQLAQRQARRDGQTFRVQSLEVELQTLDKDIAYHAERIEDLTIRAPVDGRLLAAQPLRRLIGVQLKQGEEVGTVVGEGRRTIAVVLPQGDASVVHPEMEARVRLWGDSRKVHHGRVKRVGSQFVQELPHEALSGRYGGEVDIQPTNRYKSTPSARSVLAEIELEAEDAVWIDGLTGRGKVVLGRSTLGQQQWRLVRQALSLDWWL
jgi:putative peptide zinc metalloprotease protein